MNIQKIYSAQVYATPQIKIGGINSHLHTNLKISQPLKHDTVSFQGKAVKVVTNETKALLARKQARAIRYTKLIDEAKTAPTKKELSGDDRIWGVEFSTSQKIRKMILKPQEQVHEFLHTAFDDLQDGTGTKNLILKMSDRAKSVVSIQEKSATRKWNSVKEILANMTDLNGAKIVMNNKTGQKDVETVLDRLIPLIKMERIKLKEIELQRPEKIKTMKKAEQEEFDYVSKNFLDKLEDIQEQVINGAETDPDKIVLIDRPLPKYTKGNYCALHLLLELNEKGARPFELQIMGARMSEGKIFDDKRFKFFDGKQLDKKYNDLVKLWEPLIADENKDAKEQFLKYCRDANYQLRLDELNEFKTQKTINRPTGLFKTVREYNLPPEYDLNAQLALMHECEHKVMPEETKEVEKPVLKVKVIAKKIIGKIGIKSPKNKNKKS